MEVSVVRQRVLEAIERAKRAAAERRVVNDEAAREYEAFLEQLAVPLFRQVANVLRAEGYLFNVFTPGGSVRLMSDDPPTTTSSWRSTRRATPDADRPNEPRARRPRHRRRKLVLNATAAIRELTEKTTCWSFC